MLDVRRPVPASSTSTYGVRSKYGTVTRQARPGPGRRESAQRIGCVTENTQRPPGRSTRATSRITAAESATNGTAPYAEKARSKLASANGSRLASAWTQRHAGTRRPASIRRASAQLAGREVESRRPERPGRPASARTGPRRSRPRAPGGRPTGAEQVGVGLAQRLRDTRRSRRRRGSRRARPGSRRLRRPTTRRLARRGLGRVDGGAAGPPRPVVPSVMPACSHWSATGLALVRGPSAGWPACAVVHYPGRAHLACVPSPAVRPYEPRQPYPVSPQHLSTIGVPTT